LPATTTQPKPSTSASASSSSQLAILGGPKTVESFDADLFKWPIVTEEDEKAVIDVLRAGTMSQTNISKQFEGEWGQFIGTKFNLCHPNGTASLLGAFFGVGLGRGDELISPSLTYWATAMPCMALGATPVFADIEKDSICIDPADIERRITKRTKAIVVVHYSGHPCDMDAIMAIAKKRNLKVIEDVSHAHGARYKGKMTGNIGDVACFSMMASKSFPIGEGGMLSTNDRTIYERALAFGHYERMGELTLPDLRPLAGAPLGGVKHRINQTASAMGRVQLKHYPQRIKAGVDIVGISHFGTFLNNTESYRRDLRRAEYGDERDAKMKKVFDRISPLNNASKITSPLFVAQGRNDPRVPYTEAEQIVKAVRGNGQPVWYLLYADEGHGFQKKANADYYGAAAILFWQRNLLD